MLNCLKKNTIGLDIGSSSIKVVQLAKSQNNFAVKNAFICNLNNNNKKDFQASDQAIIDGIKKVLKVGSLSNSQAICGISGPDVAVRNFELPLMPEEQLNQAVQFEASQLCPFDFAFCTLDHQVIQNTEAQSKGHQKGIIAMANNSLVEHCTEIIEKTSAECSLIDINGLALLNCLNQTNTVTLDNSYVIIDIGNKYTNIAIQGIDGVPFVRDINYGISDIISKYAQIENISYEEANKVIQAGQNNIEDFVPAIKKLISTINETIAYYESTGTHSNINTIYLCGGIALIKGIAELLNTTLPTEVKIWNPFNRFYKECTKECIELLNKKGPALALAAGLAMRTI